MQADFDRFHQLAQEYASDGASLRETFFRENSRKIIHAALVTCIALTRGSKVLICGNGGSAGDAQHIAGEFVNRFLFDRPGLPALALTTDTSVLTAIANDYDYEQIFARQVRALGQKGDVFIAISTSGKSPNVLAALDVAANKGLYRIGLTGASSPMKERCDICLNVPSDRTPLIQEVHLACEHLYCMLVEDFMFRNFAVVKPWLMEEKIPDANI